MASNMEPFLKFPMADPRILVSIGHHRDNRGIGIADMASGFFSGTGVSGIINLGQPLEI